jgi:CheY-like chemotaxis protein
VISKEVTNQKPAASSPPHPAGVRRWRLRAAGRLVLLQFVLFVLCVPLAARAADAYDAALDRRFAEPQGSTNPTPAASDPHLAAIERALKAEQQNRSEGPPAAPPETITRIGWMALTASLLVVILALSRMIKSLNDRLKNQILLSDESREQVLREKLIAEEPTLVSFFNELRYGLAPSADKAAAGSSEEIWTGKSKQEAAARLREFFATAPDQIASLRAQFSKITRAPEKAARVELLREFFHQLNALKEKAGLPELRPAWLMICGLQGLVQQLSMTATNINPSVLRTAAGAVDVLETLCAPGVDPNLATRTPVELLAVDDNAVCLAAVSLALKKAFRQPDLAPEGFAGLAFAQQKEYDAIFLDVEMPGMDGFELCQKIHETYLNRTTPIIFVTSHSDFNSRAQSTLVGGQDLIAKPFLSFEITVKALTLTLRGRLENEAEEAEAPIESVPCPQSA